MRILSQFLLLGLVATLASGCASRSIERASCDQRDWFELGRHDGAQGATEDKLARHSKECRKDFRSDWQTMYANGRNAGLAEYCTAENAFELGKMGVAYMYVCPSTVEGKFLNGYRLGQRARELEMQNKTLEGKIESIAEKLNSTQNDFDKARMTSELAELHAIKSRNERELDKTLSKHQ